MKFRLLMVCPYYPPHVGGVEQYAAALHEALAAETSIEAITVLTSALPTGAPAVERQGKITVIRYPAVQLVTNFPVPAIWRPAYWRAIRQARQSRPTLVFSHTRFFISSLVAWRLARRLGVKWIHIEHGSDFVQTGGRAVQLVARLYDQTIGQAVLRSADALIAISQAVADFIESFVGRQATVIYRGMDAQLVQTIKGDPAWRRQFGGNVLVCYVGRLVTGKGVFDLVSAAGRLKDQPIRWLIVGDGPQAPAFKAAVKAAGLQSRFSFVGAQPLTKALTAMKTADIFVNPSYTEGLPTTVLEAAFLGRPVVATDVGGTREIISDGLSGYLIPPRQPKRLAAAVAELTSNRVRRRQFGQTAAAAAAEKFNWARSTQIFLRCCRTTVKN